MPLRASRPTRHNVAAVLLEVLIALAVFIGAAAAALAATRNAARSIDRSERRCEAVDLACSLMAQLETGMISLADLRAGIGMHGRQIASSTTDDALIEASSSAAESSGVVDAAAAPSLDGTAWRVEAFTRPNEFRGLTLVELTVTQERAAAEEAERYTLRRLMRLNGGDE